MPTESQSEISTRRLLQPHETEGTGDSFNTFLSRSMPYFVVDQIVRRLRFVCIAIICFAVFVVLTYTAVFTIREPLSDFSMIFSLMLAFAFASVTLYLLRRERSQRDLIIISVLFGLVMAYGGALHDGFWPYPDNYKPDPRPFFTCIWLVLYPLIVPLAPRLSLGIALGSTGMVLTALATPLLVAPERVPPLIIFRMALETHLMMSALAYAASRMINHLNWKIAQERRKGSYELVKPLGAGSMGQVWLARHRMLHRPAAMKIIHSDKLDGATPEIRNEVITRFEREAQATASLFCPHSIALYDFGTMDDGSFFYVMEALDGFDLEEFVKEHGRLSPERTVYLLLQICESLSEAHRVGLIHRDLKPANVFVCRHGLECDFVKVLDFGMVKLAGDELEHPVSRPLPASDTFSPELTMEGHITGTPAFMAPEMIRLEPIDHRYDIYALGCVAYWLVTGRRVFEAQSFEQQLAAHLRKDPVPPEQHLEEKLPEGLQGMILDCLAKMPEDRPQSTEVIIDRLCSISPGQSWTREHAAQWWKRHVPRKDWASTESESERALADLEQLRAQRGKDDTVATRM